MTRARYAGPVDAISAAMMKGKETIMAEKIYRRHYLWTDAEDNLLRPWLDQPIDYGQLVKLLPRRSVNAISQRITQLRKAIKATP